MLGKEPLKRLRREIKVAIALARKYGANAVVERLTSEVEYLKPIVQRECVISHQTLFTLALVEVDESTLVEALCLQKKYPEWIYYALTFRTWSTQDFDKLRRQLLKIADAKWSCWMLCTFKWVTKPQRRMLIERIAAFRGHQWDQWIRWSIEDLPYLTSEERNILEKQNPA